MDTGWEYLCLNILGQPLKKMHFKSFSLMRYKAWLDFCMFLQVTSCQEILLGCFLQILLEFPINFQFDK